MENRYIKTITLKDSYFTKEFEKKKKDITKIRGIREETVAKFFKDRSCEILVMFKDTGAEILITPDSDADDIRKYLGKKFL